MFIPHTYLAALILMLVSMLCWGSWANTQKIDKRWRFELFYWDYTWGLLACALVFGLTLGSRNPASPDSFFRNLSDASVRSLLEAFFGGVIFNLGNLLLVAAISVAGMAVAFPIGAGLALVIGAVINYIISPKGNPILLFGGIALICVAILLDAMAYRGLSGGAKATTKGVGLSLACGVAVGLFYPFVAKALTGPESPGPLHGVFRFCPGRAGVQFSDELCIDAPSGQRPTAANERLFQWTDEPARMGDIRRGHLGHRHDCQLCSFLRADDRTRHIVLAGRRQHDDLRHLGHFCVEGVSWCG